MKMFNDLFIYCFSWLGHSSQDIKLCSIVLCKACSTKTLTPENVNLHCMMKGIVVKHIWENTALKKNEISFFFFPRTSDSI